MENSNETKKTVYVLNYGSYIEEDSSIYVECVGVYGNIEDARKEMQRGLESVLKEDFDYTKEENLAISKTENSWTVTDPMADEKTITEKIEQKVIR